MAVDVEMLKSLQLVIEGRADLHAAHERHVLFQTSTLDALLDGAYDGDMTVGELIEQGDTGIGTFEACDGELILLDGRVYRARVDGSIEQAPAEEKTPFAVATIFEADRAFTVENPISRGELLAQVDRETEDADCYALRITGVFEFVQARSVKRQRKPYPPLAEVIAGQNVFELRATAGTMVGFRFPDFAQGINVAGYHLHYLDAEKAHGGHVMDFKMASGRVELDRSIDLQVELPAGAEMAKPDASRGKRDQIGKLEGN